MNQTMYLNDLRQFLLSLNDTGKTVKIECTNSDNSLATITELDWFEFRETNRQEEIILKNNYEFDGRIYITTKNIKAITIDTDDLVDVYNIKLNDGIEISIHDETLYRQLKEESNNEDSCNC